ncbi:hypothetical protein DYB32_006885 [Aphanomyces invadans]|uniref:Tryptophan synthase beta chain-like PALP domain-containing protein n=1 Tax=Aphanomyces invadans TaxID=157072 RepID=A0A418AQ43_9STRA|nr:hypothetical protein DYB32_006885 [Aphanomyces invadans]
MWQRVASGVALVAGGAAAGVYLDRLAKQREGDIKTIVEAIGNTPLLEITSLSKLTGCRILAKAEYVPTIFARARSATMTMTTIATGMHVVGTGGTIGGVSRFLKEQNQSIQVWHIDPMEGGASSDYVNTKQSTIGPDGFEYIPKREGATVRREFVAEGIGLARVTPNFKTGYSCVYFLRHTRRLTGVTTGVGLFVGPSAALNVVGAVKMAREMGPGHTIVTVLCDGGDRYRSKLYNAKWLEIEKLTDYVNAPLQL